MPETGWRRDQAAVCAGVSVTSTPSRKLTPRMTLGNWFSPLSLRQVLAAAMTSLNTISRAVACDSAPLVRTVRCRTVANTLSIGFAVRRLPDLAQVPLRGGLDGVGQLVQHVRSFVHPAPLVPGRGEHRLQRLPEAE